MASDMMIAFRIESDADKARVMNLVPRTNEKGQWLIVNDVDGASNHNGYVLSKELAIPVVTLCAESFEGSVTVEVVKGGKCIRAIHFSPNLGWSKNGRKQSFENDDAVKAWLKRGSLAVQAMDHGEQVFLAVLGLGGMPPLLGRSIIVGGSNVSLLLHPSVVEEAIAQARRRKMRPNDLIVAAWELGKHALFERVKSNGINGVLGQAAIEEDALSKVRPGPQAVPTDFLRSRGAVAALHFAPAEKLTSELCFPQSVLDEMRMLSVSFDRSWTWLVEEAYLLARPLIAGEAIELRT